MMAGMDLPQLAIRQQIAGAVHMIVQISRLADGSRKCVYVTEIQGMEGNMVTLQDIFKYEQTGVNSEGKLIGITKRHRHRPEVPDEVQRQRPQRPGGDLPERPSPQ